MTHTHTELESKKLRVRYSGTHGTIIHMHRSLRKLTLTPTIIISIILLPILFDVLLWSNLELITRFWGEIFEFWMHKLNLEGSVYYIDINLPGKIAHIPFTDLPITTPSNIAIWTNIVVSVLFFMSSYYIPKNYMPLTYILRAALIIQISASIYFIFGQNHKLYDMKNYISGMLVVGIYLMFIISPFLALIYYIFDFHIWHKIMATLMIISYFIIVLPFQYMLHAYIISSGSLLFMPTLYLLFGVLLNSLMFIGCFSWIMTWRDIDKINT